MNTGRSLNEVIKELERQHSAKADFIAPARGMRMQDDGSTFEISNVKTKERQEFTAVIQQIKNSFDSHFILEYLKDKFCRQSVCFKSLGQIVCR